MTEIIEPAFMADGQQTKYLSPRNLLFHYVMLYGFAVYNLPSDLKRFPGDLLKRHLVASNLYFFCMVLILVLEEMSFKFI